MSRYINIVALGFLLVLVLGACGGGAAQPVATTIPDEAPTEAPVAAPTEAPVATEAPVTAPIADIPVKDLYAVGDSARVDPFVVAVSDIRAEDEIEGSAAPSDQQYILVDLTLSNTGAEGEDVSMLLQMILEDGAGQQYAVAPEASMNSIMTLNGSVDAGETVTGTVGFLVPESAESLRFVFRTMSEGATAEKSRAAFAVEP